AQARVADELHAEQGHPLLEVRSRATAQHRHVAELPDQASQGFERGRVHGGPRRVGHHLRQRAIEIGDQDHLAWLEVTQPRDAQGVVEFGSTAEHPAYDVMRARTPGVATRSRMSWTCRLIQREMSLARTTSRAPSFLR